MKLALLDNPECIKQLLEEYGFAHISVKSSEIRCARAEKSNPSAISIRLEDNDGLYCTDYVNGNTQDLFGMICTIKNVPFKQVMVSAKACLGDKADAYTVKTVKKSPVIKENTVLDEKILEKYPKIFSYAFLKDKITLSAQIYFDIRYDEESDRVVFPIHDANGDLISLKGRVNHPVFVSEPKYIYLFQCAPSETLYGYACNKYYCRNSTIFIGESEKMVMQAYGYGYRNAFGIAGNHLSTTQCSLIAALFPEKVILMLDKGLDPAVIRENVQNLQNTLSGMDTKLCIWEPGTDIPDKASPTDMGKEAFEHILHTQIERIG